VDAWRRHDDTQRGRLRGDAAGGVANA
jgi:hypothetical protein